MQLDIGLGPQIAEFIGPSIFLDGPLFLQMASSFLPILLHFNQQEGHWPILMAPPFTNPEYSLIW